MEWGVELEGHANANEGMDEHAGNEKAYLGYHEVPWQALHHGLFAIYVLRD